MLKLLQLVRSATKNAKSAVTYVTISASSLEYLLAGYTAFRKTTKKPIPNQFNIALFYGFKEVIASYFFRGKKEDWQASP